MRRSTVVVHGEVLVIRKLVVAGVISAEKSYIECLTAMKEVIYIILCPSFKAVYLQTSVGNKLSAG